jgi:hypothetical protein
MNGGDAGLLGVGAMLVCWALERCWSVAGQNVAIWCVHVTPADYPLCIDEGDAGPLSVVAGRPWVDAGRPSCDAGLAGGVDASDAGRSSTGRAMLACGFLRYLFVRNFFLFSRFLSLASRCRIARRMVNK